MPPRSPRLPRRSHLRTMGAACSDSHKQKDQLEVKKDLTQGGYASPQAVRAKEAAKQDERAARNAVIAAAPDKLRHASHDHVLHKTTHQEVPKFRQAGKFTCSICGEPGSGYLYYCKKTGFAAKPACVGI